MSTLATTTSKIAISFGLDEAELRKQSLVSFLHEQRRQLLRLRLDILARYHAESITDLEARIADGRTAEHPAWEDLITVENLTSRLEELDAYLAELQGTTSHRPR